jgi:hypothetical protein
MAVAHDVVEKEVVQLVGADLGFRALDRFTGLHRHELGGDRGGENCLQHLVRCSVELVGSLRPADQILDQRLGNPGIDRVVAHLVAHAVGAPAERQLGKAAALIGEAEEVVRPEPRLHVLEGDS